MKEIKTEIIINTNLQDVWQTITDFKHYPLWNTFITHISGELGVGKVLSVTIKPPGKTANIFNSVIINCQPNKELRWIGKLFSGWLFRGEHYFCLKALDKDKTLFKHGEIFSGFLANLLLLFIRDSAINGFRIMNEELKNRVENNSQAAKL